ncbi:MAG: hypothetical protein WAW96_09695, partial [Alphaproteobacteria bacterium]
MRFNRFLIAIFVAATAATACSTTGAVKSKDAALAFDPKNIDGPWEAYPQFGGKADPSGPSAPARIPDPPLKPEYVVVW